MHKDTHEKPHLPPYAIIRSARRTTQLQIHPDGRVVVRCPVGMSDKAVAEFVCSKAKWLEHHLGKLAAQPKAPALTMEDIRRLAQEAMEVIPARVKHFAPLVGVRYKSITIRNQRSRWGSCSGRGNLNFNCLLMLAPEEVLDYVVVHELCHRKEMNHSPRFWAEVERVLPDFAVHRAWLKENGGGILGRMRDCMSDGDVEE